MKENKGHYTVFLNLKPRKLIVIAYTRSIQCDAYQDPVLCFLASDKQDESHSDHSSRKKEKRVEDVFALDKCGKAERRHNR